MSAVSPRESFLRTLRARLAEPAPANHLRPVAPDPAPPPIAYAADIDDPVAAFAAAARAVGAHVDDVDDPAAYVAGICRDRVVARAVVSEDPECAGVAAALADLGVDLAPLGDVAAAAAAEIGVTGAAHGLALTGSLVVDSARAGARTASLLPPTHVALLRRDTIVADVGALLRDLGTVYADGLPSNLVLITGPSRSADIELQLTVGVHGPSEVHIGLL